MKPPFSDGGLQVRGVGGHAPEQQALLDEAEREVPREHTDTVKSRTPS